MPVPAANLQITFQYVVSDHQENPTASLTVTNVEDDEQLACIVIDVAPFDSLDETYAALVEASRRRQALLW